MGTVYEPQFMEEFMGHKIFMHTASISCPSLNLRGFHWQDHRQLRSAIKRELNKRAKKETARLARLG